MPYITTQDVKRKRQEIRKKFPNLKISVRRSGHSLIRIVILEGDVNFGSVNASVNEFHFEDHDYPYAAKKVLREIIKIASEGQRELVYDGDYGSVPNFYISVRIGDWDKDYKFLRKEYRTFSYTK